MVIVPGQEGMLGTALGLGQQLPEDCHFTGGEVNGRTVRGRYSCGDRDVEIEASPKVGASPSGSPPTFVVARVSGPQLPKLLDAVTARLRAIEGQVRWSSAEADRERRETDPGPPILGVLLLLVMLVPVGLDLRAAIGPVQASGHTVALGMSRRGAAIRALGMFVVFAAAWTAAATLWDRRVDIFAEMVAIAGTLWLCAAGFFGYASTRRGDVLALGGFALALIVREGWALHSIDALELSFSRDLFDRHSVLYPLLQAFFVAFAKDPEAAIMHANGIAGALAALPLYLFVRQRTASTHAAVCAALIFAVQPLVGRFAPTDGTFSLLLLTWFAGLALLSDPQLGARGLVGGAILLAIGATSRIEGTTLLIVAALLLDPSVWWRAVRQHPGAAVLATSLAAAIGAAQAIVLLPYYLRSPALVSSAAPSWQPFVNEALWPVAYNHRAFVVLALLGMCAGVTRRYRLGAHAFVGSLILLAPCVGSSDSAIMLHRLVPTCAMQSLAASVGVWVLSDLVPFALLRRLLPIVAALSLLWLGREQLTHSYLFNEEYDLVRSRLLVDGVPPRDCSVLMMTSLVNVDADLHGLEKVVPGMPTVDCAKIDCAREVLKGGCFYYVRSAACFYYDGGLPRGCEDTCPMVDVCARFENATELELIESRWVYPLDTFPTARLYYPRRAEVGVYRVRTPAPEGR